MTPPWLLATFQKTADVFVRSATAVDDYGNPVYENVLLASYACALTPMSSGDLTGGRAGTDSFTLYLPAEAAGGVDTFSLVSIDGSEYEVDGPPQIFTELYSPQVHHVEVNLSRSTA